MTIALHVYSLVSWCRRYTYLAYRYYCSYDHTVFTPIWAELSPCNCTSTNPEPPTRVSQVYTLSLVKTAYRPICTNRRVLGRRQTSSHLSNTVNRPFYSSHSIVNTVQLVPLAHVIITLCRLFFFSSTSVVSHASTTDASAIGMAVSIFVLVAGHFLVETPHSASAH